MILAKPTRDILGRMMAVGAAILAVSGMIATLRHAVGLAEGPEPATSVPAASYAFASPVNSASLSSLMVAEFDAPQSFRPAASPDGPTVCDTLARIGFSNSGWAPSRVATDRWECYATSGATTGTAAYRVFYMLRGTARRIDDVLVKLTLREASAAAALDAEVVGLLDELTASAHIEFPPAVLASVRSRNWVTYVSPGATYSFDGEAGDVPKWNLRIALADPKDRERTSAVLRLPARAMRGPHPAGLAAPSNRSPAEEQ